MNHLRLIRLPVILLLSMFWLLSAQFSNAAATDTKQISASAAATTPVTNAEIRQWYNDQVAKIPEENDKWIQQGLSTERRARNAYEIRHHARLEARRFMRDKKEVALLQARDQEKYGNPDGPTFAQLVESSRKKGLSDEAAHQEIIGSANRTNEEYNKKFDVKKNDKQ